MVVFLGNDHALFTCLDWEREPREGKRMLSHKSVFYDVRPLTQPLYTSVKLQSIKFGHGGDKKGLPGASSRAF